MRMGSFKFWLEANLRREQQQQVQTLYDLVVKTLLGSASGQTQLSLGDIKDDAGANQPPNPKGSSAALKKLDQAQVFQKLQALNIPDLSTRAHDTQIWLQQISKNMSPTATVGGLLNRLFGPDATETYGKHKWTAKPEAPTQPPQNPVPNQNQQMPQPQETPPEMPQQMPPQPNPNNQPQPNNFPPKPPGGLQMA